MSSHGPATKKTSTIICAVIILLAAFAGYSIGRNNKEKNTPTATTSDNSVLMTVSYTGGLCPDGICSTTYKLYNDGAFEKHKTLTSAELSELKTTINNTDFLKYPKNPRPTCPSYADGQDTALQFPQKYQDKVFTLCELDISRDDVVINYIKNLINSHELQR